MKKYKKFFLVGHSLGGQIAIQLLRQLNVWCRGVILLGTPPINHNTNLAEVYNINNDSLLLLKSKLSNDEVNRLGSFLIPEDTKWKSIIKESIYKTDPSFREQYALSLNDKKIYDEIEILRKFQGKKYFINGSNDPLINLNYIKELASKLEIPSTEIYNCGHWPQLERPKQFNELLFQFLIA